MNFTPYSITLLFICLFMVIFYSYLWPRRALRGVRPLSWIFLAVALWCIGVSFRYATASLGIKQFWVIVSYAGIVSTPLLFLFFVVEYCGFEPHFQKRYLKLIWIFPVATLIAAATNPLHRLFWSNINWRGTNLVFWYGPLFWFHIVYVIFTVVIATALLIRTLFNSTGVLRRQLMLFFIASLLPIASVAAYVAKILPFEGVDFSPIAFVISALLLGYDVMRFDFLDVIPVAHHSVFDTMRGGVLILDRMNRVIDCNNSMANYFGQKIAAGVHLAEIPGINGEICKAAEQKVPVESEIYDAKSNRFFELRMTPLKNGIGRILILNDITERKHSELKLIETNATLSAKLEEIQQLHEQLKEQALKDSLTGLYNRRFLDDILQKELSRAKRKGNRFALIMIDVDNFKEVNDSLGHDYGDRVLKQICTAIIDNIRESDYACRYGGDEIIVLLTNITRENALEKAEAFRHCVENLFEPGMHEGITLSVGVSVFPDDGTDALHIFKHADKALYRAKREGRNRVVMYSTNSEG